MVKPKKGWRIEVRWRDAYSMGGWITNVGDYPKDALVRTIGYVQSTKGNFLTVMGSKWESDDHAGSGLGGDFCSIPWDMVLSWKRLQAC